MVLDPSRPYSTPPNKPLSDYILSWFDADFSGYGVDVGASDGRNGNTTYLLEKQHRWTILSVEANPEFYAALHRHRAWVEMCACDSAPAESAEFSVHVDAPEAWSSLRPSKQLDTNWAVSGADGVPVFGTWRKDRWITTNVRVRTIDELVEKWQFPRIDLLCVDVEGTELDVLRGCDINRWKPKVIVSECWNETGPIDDYLRERGYHKMIRMEYNDVFVRLE